MAIKFENVGIAVRDLEATISFFTDLGLTVVGRDTVSGEWTDTAVGLDGNHAKIAMLQTPDGHGRLELFEYIHPEAIESEPTRPNEDVNCFYASAERAFDPSLEGLFENAHEERRIGSLLEDVTRRYGRGSIGSVTPASAAGGLDHEEGHDLARLHHALGRSARRQGRLTSRRRESIGTHG